MRLQNKHLTLAVVFLLLLMSSAANAQSDWHTYPARSINEIINAHSAESFRDSDVIVSGDPLPSKTILAYTGQHRPVDEWKKHFIKVWSETRSASPNTKLLTEEYLFKEKGAEYWITVISHLTPYFEKELKAGDEITGYYFFLGGYNEKTLREKRKDKRPMPASLENKIEWVFVLEEFEK